MSNKNTTNNEKDAFELLRYAYSQIPDTKGCMKHISMPKEEGGCGAWCCDLQSPQILYIEFLNAWRNLCNNWSDSDIKELLSSAVYAYLFPKEHHGCIFWDKETKLCGHHEVRGYNCRTYGVIPEEEFKPRYERLKVLYPDTPDQCNLIETEDGSKVTSKKMDEWWKMVLDAEKKIGISEENIHDGFGGSYRHYHEHILIHLLGEEGMEQLSHSRLHLSHDDKMSVYNGITEALDSFIDKIRLGKEIKDSEHGSES